MADETDTSWKLDLDNKEFINKLLESKSRLLDLGDAKNLTGLTQGLLSAGVVLGALGVAFYGVKTIMEEVFQAEDVKQINVQFEAMSKNAGLVGSALKEALVGAAGGLVDDTDLLKSANKALAEMGSNAAKLPEIMTLARQATAVMGGDVMSRFEQINQAVSMGNVKMLKHMGILVDQKKAYEDYAKSIGITVDALSQAEKQQALLTAVLDKGGKQFKGVDLNVKEATNAWTQFKVTMGEIGEITAYIFNTVFGKFVVNALKLAGQAAKDFKNAITTLWGEEGDKARLRIKGLQDEIGEKQRAIKGFEEKKLAESQLTEEQTQRFYNTTKEKHIASLDASINHQKKRAQELGDELDKLKTKYPKAEEIVDPTAAPKDKGDEELRKVQREKALAEKHKLDAELLAIHEKNAETLEEVDELHRQRKLQIEAETADKIAQIKEQARSAHITPEQETQMIVAQEEIKAARVKEIDDKMYADKNAALDRHVTRSKSAADGFANAFAAGSKKAQMEMNSFGLQGTRAFNSVKTNAVNAFKAIGNGSKNAADAMKGFIFNALGDEAQARGEILLASSIWPPNPLGIAGGGALIALGEALKSAGGGGGSSVPSGGSGGGGGGVGGFATEEIKPEAAQMAEKKTVTVAIQGNYFETEQTQTRLMEMIRQTQDATDFNLTKIGP